jgi:hypothetical protein
MFNDRIIIILWYIAVSRASRSGMAVHLAHACIVLVPGCLPARSWRHFAQFGNSWVPGIQAIRHSKGGAFLPAPRWNTCRHRLRLFVG